MRKRTVRPLWVAAPDVVRPGNRGSLTEVELTLDDGSGSPGLLCCAAVGDRTGYAVTVGTDEMWRTWRVEQGRAEPLDASRLTDAELSDEGEPTLLRLVFGTAAPRPEEEVLGRLPHSHAQPATGYRRGITPL